MPHLDDIWYVGRARTEGAHVVTFMEVKGHQRPNGLNYVLLLPYLVKRSPDAS